MSLSLSNNNIICCGVISFCWCERFDSALSYTSCDAITQARVCVYVVFNNLQGSKQCILSFLVLFLTIVSLHYCLP